jgi:hypothetical protein
MHAYVEESTYKDEPEFKRCSSPILSFHANVQSSDSTRPEAIQTIHEGPRIAPLLMNDEKSYEDEPEFKYCLSPLLSPCAGSCSSDSMHPRASCSTPTIQRVPRVIRLLAKVDEHRFDIHLGHQAPVQSAEVPHDMSPSTAVMEQPGLGSIQESPT